MDGAETEGKTSFVGTGATASAGTHRHHQGLRRRQLDKRILVQPLHKNAHSFRNAQPHR